jgi:hypothetical protein
VHALDQHVAQALVIALDVFSDQYAQVPLTQWNDAAQAL